MRIAIMVGGIVADADVAHGVTAHLDLLTGEEQSEPIHTAIRIIFDGRANNGAAVAAAAAVTGVLKAARRFVPVCDGNQQQDGEHSDNQRQRIEHYSQGRHSRMLSMLQGCC